MWNNQIKLFRDEDILCIEGEDGDLGQGGYGRVRIGFEKHLGTIAVKCSAMKGGRREKNLIEKKIKKEIGYLQTAQHDNIVRVYGWTQWNGSIAIIMEYFPAGNLKSMLLDEDIELSPLLRLRICAEISTGVAYIHNLFDEKRLLHGDIKPENILLTEDLHCKIADFGSAKLSSYTGSTTVANSNQAKSMEYTQIYAAPERLQNIATKVSLKYDTYSVGMTFHMVLARELPTGMESTIPVNVFISKIVEGQRPSLQKILDYIKALEEEQGGDDEDEDVTIITLLKGEMESCWHQNPDDRPHMTEVRDRLGNKLANRDLSVIQQHVTNAMSEMNIKKSSFDSEHYILVNKFLPPDFSTTSLSPAFSNVTYHQPTAMGEMNNKKPSFDSGQCALVNNVLAPDLSTVSSPPASLNVSEHQASFESEDEENSTEPKTLVQAQDITPEPSQRYCSFSRPQNGAFNINQVKQDVKKIIEDLTKDLTDFKKFNIFNNGVRENIRFLQDCFQNPSFAKSTAECLVRLQAVPIFKEWLNALTDNGKLYPSKSDGAECYDSLRLVIVASSRHNCEFCVQCGENKMLPMFAADLKRLQLRLQDNAQAEYVWHAVAFLFSCAKFSASFTYVKQLNIFDLLLRYSNNDSLKKKYSPDFFYLCSFLCAYLAEGEQLDLISTDQSMIISLVEAVDLERMDSKLDDYRIHQYLGGLAKLARHPDNKVTIFEKTDIVAWITCMRFKGTDEEKSMTLELIQNLHVNPNIRMKIRQDNRILNLLKKMRVEEENGAIRKHADVIVEVLQAED